MNYNYTHDDVNDYVNKNAKKWVKDVFRIHAPKLLSKAGLWTVVENLEVIYTRNASFELVIKFKNRNTDIELRFRDVGIGFTMLGETGKDYIELYLSDYLTDGIAYEDVINGDLETFVDGCAYTRDKVDEKLDKVIGLPIIKTRYGDILDYTKWKKIVQLRLMYYLFKIIKLLFEGDYDFVKNVKVYNHIKVETSVGYTLHNNGLLSVDARM